MTEEKKPAGAVISDEEEFKSEKDLSDEEDFVSKKADSDEEFVPAVEKKEQLHAADLITSNEANKMFGVDQSDEEIDQNMEKEEFR